MLEFLANVLIALGYLLMAITRISLPTCQP